MRITDLIEAFIKDMLNSGNGAAELQRNELAERFNCVPSQINYVISKHFNAENGYIVESKRGGGGCIRIRRIVFNNSGFLMHIINGIGSAIDAESSKIFINNLYQQAVISEREARIMLVALSDKTLSIPPPQRDIIRAAMLKQILVNLI